MTRGRFSMLNGDMSALMNFFQNLYPFLRKSFRIYNVKKQSKEIDSYKTEEQLEELRQEVLAKIKAIEAAEDFPPTVSKLCDWCLYIGMCPMWAHVEGIGPRGGSKFYKM